MAQETDDINLTPQELQTLSELDRWIFFPLLLQCAIVIFVLLVFI